MGASFSWRRKDPGRSFSVGARSDFVKAMVAVFDHYPWTLNGSHVAKLGAMAAVCDQEPNPYRQLIDIIDANDEIVLEVIY